MRALTAESLIRGFLLRGAHSSLASSMALTSRVCSQDNLQVQFVPEGFIPLLPGHSSGPAEPSIMFSYWRAGGGGLCLRSFNFYIIERSSEV